MTWWRVGNYHVSCAKTLFQMLPKNICSRVPSNYRPIANIRLFSKVFAYMILRRVKAQLESTSDSIKLWTEYGGQDCGVPYRNNIFQIIWFGLFKTSTGIRKDKCLQIMFADDRSRYVAMCCRVVFWIPVVCNILEMAKTCWRVAVEDLDLDLRYGGRSLFRFHACIRHTNLWNLLPSHRHRHRVGKICGKLKIWWQWVYNWMWIK